MRNIVNIARMELKMTAANKAFIIITIIGPFVILAMAFLPSLFMESAASIDEGSIVAVAGADDTLWQSLDAATERSPIELVRSDNIADLREKVRNREIQGYIVIPENHLESGTINYYSRTGTDFVMAETLQGYIGNIIVSERMQNEGLDPERISYLSSRPSVNLQKVVSGDESEEGQDLSATIYTAIAFTLLLYMTILLYGQATARSVLKEKTSKTVEIMLSSVKPIHMLFGKLFGQVLAALIQYGIWISLGVLLVSVVGPNLDFSLSAALTPQIFAFLLLYFLLAFFLYSAAYAAIGSGAEDESHLGQLGWPLIVFLVLPMILSSSIIIRPDTPLVIALSYFPLTSPIVTFIRTLVDMPELREILLCVGILLVSIVATVAASAKIFRVGILMSGKRFNLNDIIRWLRY